MPLFIFLKAPLQAGGYKAELGPLHPPKQHTCPVDQQPRRRIRGLQPGAAVLHCGSSVPETELAVPNAGGLGSDLRQVESARSSCLVFLVLIPSRAVTLKPAVTGLLHSHGSV